MQLLLRHTIVPLYLCLKRALLKLTSRASRPIGRLLRPLVLRLTIVGTTRPACVGHLHAARLQLYTPSCPLIYSFTSTLTLHQWAFQDLLHGVAACLHSALGQGQKHTNKNIPWLLVSKATTYFDCWCPPTTKMFVSTSSQVITYLGVFVSTPYLLEHSIKHTH